MTENVPEEIKEAFRPSKEAIEHPKSQAKTKSEAESARQRDIKKKNKQTQQAKFNEEINTMSHL